MVSASYTSFVDVVPPDSHVSVVAPACSPEVYAPRDRSRCSRVRASRGGPFPPPSRGSTPDVQVIKDACSCIAMATGCPAASSARRLYLSAALAPSPCAPTARATRICGSSPHWPVARPWAGAANPSPTPTRSARPCRCLDSGARSVRLLHSSRRPLHGRSRMYTYHRRERRSRTPCAVHVPAHHVIADRPGDTRGVLALVAARNRRSGQIDRWWERTGARQRTRRDRVCHGESTGGPVRLRDGDRRTRPVAAPAPVGDDQGDPVVPGVAVSVSSASGQ